MLNTTTHLHKIFDNILLRNITELDVNNSNRDEEVETGYDVSWNTNVYKLLRRFEDEPTYDRSIF